ncbi:hypothetical protein B0H17DRAFT_1164188 [Mycena rosella]|uniref:Uncharacterized protein n=1 Tax=Mycena rosella TaxID=1033263 RepID=A0AAD7BVM9_MYCRO|nr:hypothetical protein B0H17DRAFT_1164188 [Mycena rosella]
MRYASRKYIDLILTASSKWASWDPPHPIKASRGLRDRDKETGQFQKDGNIYEDAATAALAADIRPETLAPDEHMVISSEATQKREFSLGPHINVSGLVEASIKGQWKFRSGKTGVLLLMAQPRSALLPVTAFLKHLVDLPVLKDKCLVTETVSCHAYSMYLSTKSEDTISLALLATTPLPMAPLVSAGGEVGVSWWSETGGGVFTPLFVLKRVRKQGFVPYRGAPAPEDEDELWVDAESPWAPLNEDGEEELLTAKN